MKFIAANLRRLGLAVLTMLLVASSFALFTPPPQQPTLTRLSWGPIKECWCLIHQS